MEACLVDVSPILGDLGATVVVSGELQVDDLTVGAEEFIVRGPAKYEITVTHTGTAIVAYGGVSLPTVATCARCLCEFPLDINGEVEGFYVFPGKDSDVPEEQEVEYINSDETVDLAPAMLAALVLDAPFAPLHAEDCAGICLECGADLNEGTCGCGRGDGAPGHPFSALRTLVDQDSAGSSQ
ncbi:MAG: DUF177 domain-containing protein [Coriobacteriia bacterium]|nr:DUF177 domain-containing protein [Coriobacteriia bacterium]